MCGLFGWQWAESKIPNKHKRQVLAFELAKAADRRGGQSWGVWTPDLVSRGLNEAQKHSGKYFGFPNLFGHSRHATHGTNTIANAHPFIKDDVALAHNGVINNHSELNTEFKRNFVVDSQHILQHLIEKKPFTDLKGYGAICWSLPSEPGDIFMGRMSESGQLYIAMTEFGTVWGSSETDTRKALKEAGIKVEMDYEVTPGKVYYSQGGTLYVDSKHPSILVSEPVRFTSWESYSGGHTGYTGQSWKSAPYKLIWCQEHKRLYARCPCKGGMSDANPHLIMIWNDMVPKDGETYVDRPRPADEPTPKTIGPHNGKGGTRDQKYDLYCNKVGCAEVQSGFNRGYCGWEHHREAKAAVTTPRHRCGYVGCEVWLEHAGVFCMQHLAKKPTAAYVETQNGPVHPAALIPSHNLAANEARMCAKGRCFDNRKGDGLWCKRHQETSVQHGPQEIVEVPKGESVWDKLQPQPDHVRATVGNLAQWYLQAQYGITDTGMNTDEDINIACEWGFDLVEAMKVAAEPMEVS
jgi:hypothetical protein